jgi:MFS family permease
MTYFYGYLSKRKSRGRLSLASLIGSTVFLFVLGMSHVLSIAAIVLILFGAFLFLIYPALQSYVAEIIPEKNQVLAFSIVANIKMITGSAIVLIAGFLSDNFGINSPFLFLVGLGILVLANYLLRKNSPLHSHKNH